MNNSFDTPHSDFDPNAPAESDELFGLPFSAEEARVHVIPLPFDATTSYRSGAARGPQAIREASLQVDLFDLAFGKPYEAGIHMLEVDPRIEEWNRAAHENVAAYRADEKNEAALEAANDLCEKCDEVAQEMTTRVLAANKLPVGLGGDHATTFGVLSACVEKHPGLGVLHFDAHADLRIAYEGLVRSHASIMNNVLCNLDVSRLVQVGVRDLCEEEFKAIQNSGGLIHTLFDRDWAQAKLTGKDLTPLVRETLDHLPDEVYVSFDIDGLEPGLCPSTGTPVPGGLSWNEAMFWLEALAKSGKRVVGLDLCEVNPGAEGGSGLDAMVGSRLLYRLIATALHEN